MGNHFLEGNILPDDCSSNGNKQHYLSIAHKRAWLTLVANHLQDVIGDETMKELEEAPLKGILLSLGLHVQLVGGLREDVEDVLHHGHEGLL